MKPLRLRLLLALLACGTAPHGAASEALTSSVDVACNPDSSRVFRCEYRTLDGRGVTGISARSGQQALEVRMGPAYPWPGALTAVLMLVDTSDPAREPVVRSNEAHVAALDAAAGTHHVLGLASFDSRLRIVAPIGSPPEALGRAAATLQAEGMTTELYRSVLEAIQVLEAVKAERRLILLFSDGQAEDKAYYHHDVVAAARAANVVISSVGFARSVAQSVALQTLRRLSEETGGVYIDAGTGTVLPGDFANRVLANIDSGGRFSVEPKGPAGPLELRFVPPRGAPFHVTLVVPTEPEAAAMTVPPTATPAAATPEIRVITSEPERDEIDTLLWYSVPVALLVLIGLTVLMLVLLSRRPAPAQSAAASPVRPLAYLVAQDEKGTHYPVTATIWRIGRSRDNEMMLDDNSISRRHAELQRGQDGRFVLLDKNSLNGVFVNGEKIGRRELNEGDVIELGDIALRFTEAPADDQLAERTSMQHTRAPQVN